MSPSDVITFMLLGMIVLTVIGIVWFLFRKRKKWAIVISSVLLVGYVGYYLAYPTIKVNTHTKRYEQVVAYLETTYPIVTSS